MDLPREFSKCTRKVNNGNCCLVENNTTDFV